MAAFEYRLAIGFCNKGLNEMEFGCVCTQFVARFNVAVPVANVGPE